MLKKMLENKEKLLKGAFLLLGIILVMMGLSIVDHPSAERFGMVLISGVLILCTIYVVHFWKKKE